MCVSFFAELYIWVIAQFDRCTHTNTHLLAHYYIITKETINEDSNVLTSESATKGQHSPPTQAYKHSN